MTVLKPIDKPDKNDMKLTFLEMEKSGKIIPAVTLRYTDPNDAFDINRFMLTDRVSMQHSAIKEGKLTFFLTACINEPELPPNTPTLALMYDFEAVPLLNYFCELQKAQYYVISITTDCNEARIFVDYHNGEAVGWKMRGRTLH